MMGIFANHAPEYTAKGFRVFPTNGKKPLIRGWQEVGKKASIDLAKKFPDANIGVIDGDKITRIDIDDPHLLDSCIQRFGDTPVKVSTPRGGYHLWFKHNGEKRRIKLEGKKIDILGVGGFGVAPPSVNQNSVYSFCEGSLDDVDKLPTIQNLPHDIYRKDISLSSDVIREGNRINHLFDQLRSLAPSCETIDELALQAEAITEMMEPSLTTAEVTRQVRGVWKLKIDDKLIQSGSGDIVIRKNEIPVLSEYPASMVLLSYLRSNHGPKHEFCVSPTGIAPVLSLDPKTITRARDHLLNNTLLKQTYIGRGAKNPHRFHF